MINSIFGSCDIDKQHTASKTKPFLKDNANTLFDNSKSGQYSPNLLHLSDEELADALSDAQDLESVPELSNKEILNLSFGKETRDEKIGVTYQKLGGNCWFLSAINAMSYTEAGREVLQNAIEYNDDGATVAFYKFGNIDVSDKEIQKAKESKKFSSGDEDMIIFEVATAKLLDGVSDSYRDVFKNAGCKFMYSSVFRSQNNSGEKLGYTSAGGIPSFAIFLLTGKASINGISCYDKEDWGQILDDYAADENNSIVITAGIDGSEDNGQQDIQKEVLDKNGNPVTLFGPHAYAIKRADENTVTVINPHDSSVEIELQKSVFMEEFDTLYYTDLDEDAKDNYYDF